MLIAARRSDQIASELALHDFRTDVCGVEVLGRLNTMITALHAKSWPSMNVATTELDLNART